MTTHQKTPDSPNLLSITGIVVLVLLLTTGAGCGTGQVRHADNDLPQPVKADASPNGANEKGQRIVDIIYILGHDQLRFIATSREGGARAQSLEGHQVLEENPVDPKRYADFYEKALAFVKTPRRTVATATTATAPGTNQKVDNCRNTFTVLVRDGEQSWTESGCRSTDDGAFSRLVRDGQFLLYSKK